MSLLRFLGLGGPTAGRDQEPESLALLTGRLDSLPAEDARLAAAFALLLARVAGADLRTGADERDSMAERLAAFGQLEADQAKLLVERLDAAERVELDFDIHTSTPSREHERTFGENCDGPVLQPPCASFHDFA